MGITKADRAARDKAEREAAWEAEQARVRALGDLFSAVPEGPQKVALLGAMTDRVIELLNECRHEQADILIEFLPNDIARRLLDWYFDEDAPNVAPDFQRPARDEHGSPAGPSGQPLRTWAEAAPHQGAPQAPVEGKASAGPAPSRDAGRCADQTPSEGSGLLEK